MTPCLCPRPGPGRSCACSGCACHARPKALPASPDEMHRRKLRSEVKQRAYVARQEDWAAARAESQLTWTVVGPDRADDGGETCPWCERPARPGAYGLCGDCADLEYATTTPTTHRRMVARLGARARRGDIDPTTYDSALRAHRGHD